MNDESIKQILNKRAVEEKIFVKKTKKIIENQKDQCQNFNLGK
jgi:hypothetical protein